MLKVQDWGWARIAGIRERVARQNNRNQQSCRHTASVATCMKISLAVSPGIIQTTVGTTSATALAGQRWENVSGREGCRCWWAADVGESKMGFQCSRPCVRISEIG